MEGLSELIPSLIDSGSSRLWEDFLKTCRELKIFVSKSHELVPQINSLLNEPNTRAFGIRILDVFLTQCPKAIINENFNHWVNQCLNGASQSTESICLLSFSVLSSLLEESVRFSEVKKHTSLNFVPKILDLIVDKVNNNYNQAAFQCLFICLTHYGKSCGNYRDNLEKIFVSLIVADALNPYVPKTFHLLAQLGVPGVESVNYKENWHKQFLLIINSSQSVLDQLFNDVGEIRGSYSRSSDKHTLDIPVVIDESPLVKYHKLRIIYSCLCEITVAMLLEKFPTSKKIEPEAIFGVVCRSLAVTCKSLESKISNSSFALMTQISDIHISSIKLLNSLILCSGTNLLPYTPIISKLFTQIFKFTDVENWSQGRERPYSRVRETSYKCLITWMSVSKSSSLSKTLGNIISEAIIKDIKCTKKVVTLNLEKKSKSKNAKKIIVTESCEVLEMNAEVCQVALDCIPLIVRTPLSVEVVKKMQEVVVQLLFEIQRLSKRNSDFPPPYSNSKCRASLYSALLGLCISPHPQFPPPLHYANTLFNGACLDSDSCVRRVCSNAVISIAHLIRPCAPSFDFINEIDSEVVPINPYPEPSRIEIKGLSKRSVQELIQNSKKDNFENLKKDKVTFDGGKEILAKIADLNGDIDVIPCPSKADDPKENCVDLDNCPSDSDDSLILVDSQTKTKTTKITGNSSDSHNEKSTGSQVNISNDLAIKSGGSNSKRTTRNSTVQKDTDVEVIEKEDLSNSNISSLNNSTKKIISDSDEILIDPEDSGETADVYIIESVSEEKVKNNQIEALKRSRRRGQSPRQVGKCLTSDALGDIIDLGEESIIKTQCKVSKSSTVLDSIDLEKETNKNGGNNITVPSNSNKTQIETHVSDDITIIESSDACAIPPRRSKRICSRSSIMENADVEEISILPDDEEPSLKKSKTPRQCKQTESNSNSSRDKENENTIYEIEDDFEMMNSFVDAVPD